MPADPPLPEPESPSPAALTDLSIEDPAWEDAAPGLDWVALAEAAVAATLARAPCRLMPLTGRVAEVSITLDSDDVVQELNREWRDQDKPTNVLSFASLESAPIEALPPAPAPLPLGDVILALGVVRREAAAEGKSLAAHTAHLIVHGTLHCLGYGHERGADEAEIMEGLEVAILASLGIADPYRATGAEESL